MAHPQPELPQRKMIDAAANPQSPIRHPQSAMKKHPIPQEILKRIRAIQDRFDCDFQQAAGILARRRRRKSKPTLTTPKRFWWQD